jgi:hypothetical protein
MSDPSPPRRSSLSWAIALLCILISILLFLFTCITDVGEGETVIRDCDGVLTLWHAPADQGLHWDGTCSVRSYPDVSAISFREDVTTDGMAVIVRGFYIVHPPSDGDRLKEIHRTFGSHRSYLERGIDVPVRAAIRQAASQPSWRILKGGPIESELKNALEYGIRRFSPTGAIWSVPESKHALAREIQRRLDATILPSGTAVSVELGFVTEY